MIVLSKHAREQMVWRGVTEGEIYQVLAEQPWEPAKFDRRMKHRTFPFMGEWNGRRYPQKLVEVIYAEDAGDTIVVTVMASYGQWE